MKKRPYKKLPCSTCVSQAMCQHKQPLQCKILYKYIFDDHIPPSESTFQYRKRLIETMFDKKCKHFFVNSKHEFGIEWKHVMGRTI